MENSVLKGKVAIVTGASSGMGKAIAERLMDEGMAVYVAARSVDKMADLAARGAMTIGMDISKEDQILAAVKTITDGHGGVDLLVNNAGFGLYGAVEDTSIEDARYQFEVNLFGLARLTQLLLPAMRAKGAARIVNISSMGGKIYMPLGAWYHATKHALEGWSDCLRIELAPHRIDVVIVEPGIIQTGFGDVVTSQITERSGKGAYAPMAAAIKSATTSAYSSGGASKPELIANIVARAASVRRPKTRYVAGKLARPLIYLRWLVSDRIYDWIITSQVR